MALKNWHSFIKSALTPEEIKEQFKPGSHLFRIFVFSLVSSLALGVIANFFNLYSTKTRAFTTDSVSVAVSPSKQQLEITPGSNTTDPNNEFYLNIVLQAGNPISDADIKVDVPLGDIVVPANDANGAPYYADGFPVGEIEYVNGDTQSFVTGQTGTSDYFDTVLIEDVTVADNVQRIWLSMSRTPSTQATATVYANDITLRLHFIATRNGKVNISVNKTLGEIVGPGSAAVTAQNPVPEPVSYIIDNASNTGSYVLIGTNLVTLTPTSGASPTGSASNAPSPSMSPIPTNTIMPTNPPPTAGPTATAIPTQRPPTPTITIAPAPACAIPNQMRTILMSAINQKNPCA